MRSVGNVSGLAAGLVFWFAIVTVLAAVGYVFYEFAQYELSRVLA